MHDADMPFSPDAAIAWAAANRRTRALAYMALTYTGQPNTVRTNRARYRVPVLGSVSHMALRVKGALDGRIDLRVIRRYYPSDALSG